MISSVRNMDQIPHHVFTDKQKSKPHKIKAQSIFKTLNMYDSTYDNYLSGLSSMTEVSLFTVTVRNNNYNVRCVILEL